MAGARTIARALFAALLVPAALGAQPALAVPDCPGERPAARALLSGRGVLESVAVDARGRLFYTDTSLRAVLRVDAPGAEPALVADGIEQPGGLALDAGGGLLVGQGNGFANGALGNVAPRAAVLRLDPDGGGRSTYATGLSMANGLALAPDGALFASDDAGLHLDRVPPGGGAADTRWARVTSGNGLAVDATGTHLYVAQTFQPAAVLRVEIADPSNVEVFARPGAEDLAAGLDGMDRGPDGRLYVAANGAGQVWRVEPDGSICALARGLRFPSAVAVGRDGGAFGAGDLYVVTFAGDLVELPGAAR